MNKKGCVMAESNNESQSSIVKLSEGAGGDEKQ